MNSDFFIINFKNLFRILRLTPYLIRITIILVSQNFNNKFLEFWSINNNNHSNNNNNSNSHNSNKHNYKINRIICLSNKLYKWKCNN